MGLELSNLEDPMLGTHAERDQTQRNNVNERTNP